MIARTSEIAVLTDYAQKVLDLKGGELSDEYYYASLPLCVIDAVWSIGIRYPMVQKVVKCYSNWAKLPRFRGDRAQIPAIEDQDSITEFCKRLGSNPSDEDLAVSVFCSRHLTSTTNGILKATAVKTFAGVLRRHGIDYFQDMTRITLDQEKAVLTDIQSIPGQKSGISWLYFRMLAGTDDLVKPDRMILRFTESAIGDKTLPEEASVMVKGAAKSLQPRYPHLTPRLLDYLIWKYQSDKSKAEIALNRTTDKNLQRGGSGS